LHEPAKDSRVEKLAATAASFQALTGSQSPTRPPIWGSERGGKCVCGQMLTDMSGQKSAELWGSGEAHPDGWEGSPCIFPTSWMGEKRWPSISDGDPPALPLGLPAFPLSPPPAARAPRLALAGAPAQAEQGVLRLWGVSKQQKSRAGERRACREDGG